MKPDNIDTFIITPNISVTSTNTSLPGVAVIASAGIKRNANICLCIMNDRAVVIINTTKDINILFRSSSK